MRLGTSDVKIGCDNPWHGELQKNLQDKIRELEAELADHQRRAINHRDEALRQQARAEKAELDLQNAENVIDRVWAVVRKWTEDGKED